MVISAKTGLCTANNDQKGIYDLKNFTVQSLEDNHVALICGDASKKGERDIHLRFETSKEKRDWIESFRIHFAYAVTQQQLAK